MQFWPKRNPIGVPAESILVGEGRNCEIAQGAAALGAGEPSFLAAAGGVVCASVLNPKFYGLQIDSMIADSPDFGEDWRWVDALCRWSWIRWNVLS